MSIESWKKKKKTLFVTCGYIWIEYTFQSFKNRIVYNFYMYNFQLPAIILKLPYTALKGLSS